MANRLTKIYTRTGDDGSTGLADGQRVTKSDPRVEALGTIDELNSSIGMLLAEGVLLDNIRESLVNIQHQLFNLGGEISTPDAEFIKQQQVDALEHMMDELNVSLPTLEEFILPGGAKMTALCQFVRAVCRRAERALVSLHESHPINLHSLSYINRLSDLLFVFARIIAREEGAKEVLWSKGI